MTLSRQKRVLGLLAMLLLCVFPPPVAAQNKLSAEQFVNPVLDTGPDPWVTQYKGVYYYMNTTQKSLTIWKTTDLSDLRNAEKKVVWRPEPGHPWSSETWAPELHRWDGKWYIYFAADGGRNSDHRIYVVENPSDDPMQGEWMLKGKVADSTDRWAIDADIFEVNGTHYMVWSGWKGPENGEQDIYLARMKNPWTLDSERVLLSTPDHPWEQVSDGKKVLVNEGPEAILHDGKVFVVYSASGCWTDAYELGVMQASASADLLSPASWKKYDYPFFKQDPKASVYATGHNGFFKSPDGKQDWIIYHANSAPGQGCGAARSPRMQPFSWNADGTPNFGTPLPVGTQLAKPSH